MARNSGTFPGVDRFPGKARVMLLTGKALLLGGGQDLAVPQERGGTVVVVGGNAEDMDGWRH